MNDELAFDSATNLAAKVAAGELSSVELTQHYIDRILRLDSALNAVVVRTFDQALIDAQRADQALARGEALGPLHGVPMTIKESYVMAGTPSTWGMDAYRDNVSETDGLAVARFRQAGAIFLGKTNVPLDLADYQSYNDIYGTTNNPWNHECVPGGSSGGSAAAVAAGLSALEAGSDIGGSIRTPAHCCGVYGHKPTWGIVPQEGHELFPGVPDSDLSVCGPLARDADDLEVALKVMAGPSGRAATGWQLALPESRIHGIENLRVAVWADDPVAPVSHEVSGRVMAIADSLAAQGAIVSHTARPDFDPNYAQRVYQSLLTAVMPASAPADAVPTMVAQANAFADDDQSLAAVAARGRVMMHRDWIRQNLRREKLRRAWDEFFEEWDILLCPQFSRPAFKHDHSPLEERTLEVDGKYRPYFETSFWSGLAIASYLPSTVFPTGVGAQGLPIGVQATAGPYRDLDTIAFAKLMAEIWGGFAAPPDY